MSIERFIAMYYVTYTEDLRPCCLNQIQAGDVLCFGGDDRGPYEVHFFALETEAREFYNLLQTKFEQQEEKHQADRNAKMTASSILKAQGPPIMARVMADAFFKAQVALRAKH